jgi:hypothetical protein
MTSVMCRILSIGPGFVIASILSQCYRSLVIVETFAYCRSVSRHRLDNAVSQPALHVLGSHITALSIHMFVRCRRTLSSERFEVLVFNVVI